MVDLSYYNNLLEELKKESRGPAILNGMKNTLEKMKVIKGGKKYAR